MDNLKKVLMDCLCFRLLLTVVKLTARLFFKKK